MNRSPPPKRRMPLPTESAKRKAERPARARILASKRTGVCAAKDLVPEVECGGPLDVHELKSRGVHPGGHLEPDNCVVVCRAHHDWVGREPALAYERGLKQRSWE